MPGPEGAAAVVVRAAGAELEGILSLPEGCPGIVLFAHGSGSSRHSSRNRYVASALHRVGLGTLLFDLLTPDEEVVDARTRHLRFDIPRLAERVVGAVDWIRRRPDTRALRVGLFGASTGAAAALVAASARADDVDAVVSRGGRPDLAGDALPAVRAPTLMLVGSRDPQVLELNHAARARMIAPCRLDVVEGATHLFEEPGALEEVAARAGGFLSSHLGRTEPAHHPEHRMA